MKNIFLCLFLLCGIFSAAAQTGFKYQSVIRDGAGEPVANQSVSLRFGIIQGLIGNSPIYTETHSVTTNDYGVVTVNIGQGTVISGIFSEIDWGLESFVKIEADVNGGTSYVLFGTSELLNVPRPMYAEKSG